MGSTRQLPPRNLAPRLDNPARRADLRFRCGEIGGVSDWTMFRLELVFKVWSRSTPDDLQLTRNRPLTCGLIGAPAGFEPAPLLPEGGQAAFGDAGRRQVCWFHARTAVGRVGP
jgi:hypothetical protein